MMREAERCREAAYDCVSVSVCETELNECTSVTEDKETRCDFIFYFSVTCEIQPSSPVHNENK